MAAPSKKKTSKLELPAPEVNESAGAAEPLPVPAGHTALFHDTATSCNVPAGAILANDDGSFHVPTEYVAALIESHGFKAEG
jgi:hypothetical protein